MNCDCSSHVVLDSDFNRLQRHQFWHNLTHDVKTVMIKILNTDSNWKKLTKYYVKHEIGLVHTIERSKDPAKEFVALFFKGEVPLNALYRDLHAAKIFEGLVVLSPYVRTELRHELELIEGQSFAAPPKVLRQYTDEEVKALVEAFINEVEEEAHLEKPVLGHIEDVDFDELMQITKIWDERKLIGRGTFGASYQCRLRGVPVVVKRLVVFDSQSIFNHEKHLHKVMKHAIEANLVPHPNILPLIACCLDIRAPCLIYNVQERGSLVNYLKRGVLTWFDKLRIARGVIRGLQYIHTCVEGPAFHGNLRSCNIFLNDLAEPKLSDYGLGMNVVEPRLDLYNLKGIRPHLPRNFFNTGEFNAEVDIYSYGVLMLELALEIPAYSEERRYHHIVNYFERMSWFELYNFYDHETPNNFKIFNQLLNLSTLCSNSEEVFHVNMNSLLKLVEQYWDILKLNVDEKRAVELKVENGLVVWPESDDESEEKVSTDEDKYYIETDGYTRAYKLEELKYEGHVRTIRIRKKLKNMAITGCGDPKKPIDTQDNNYEETKKIIQEVEVRQKGRVQITNWIREMEESQMRHEETMRRWKALEERRNKRKEMIKWIQEINLAGEEDGDAMERVEEIKQEVDGETMERVEEIQQEVDEDRIERIEEIQQEVDEDRIERIEEIQQEVDGANSMRHHDIPSTSMIPDEPKKKKKSKIKRRLQRVFRFFRR